MHSAPPRQPLVVEKLQDVQAVEQFGEIRLQVVIHGEPGPKVSRAKRNALRGRHLYRRASNLMKSDYQF